MAIQFKIIARVIAMLFNIESEPATILAAGIVILYSTFGGIKSVIFTDILQFFTFGTVFPILALTIWNNLQNSSQVMATLADNPNFNMKEIVS